MPPVVEFPGVSRLARSGDPRYLPCVEHPSAELDALKAELKRLRWEVGRGVAMAHIQADPGPADDAPAFTRAELAEAWRIGE
jgi:hypothetical protein